MKGRHLVTTSQGAELNLSLSHSCYAYRDSITRCIWRIYVYHTLLYKLGGLHESLLRRKLNPCKYTNTHHIHEPTVTQSLQADRSTLHSLCLAALQTYPFLSGTSLSCPANRENLQSLRTQSAEPGSTGFFGAPDCS